MKKIVISIVLMVCCQSASVHDWRDKFSKMIENGRTLNCSKTSGVRLHSVPVRNHQKLNSSAVSDYHNGSCSLGLEHVELHFNITNVFEDNSNSNPVAQQYVEYEDGGSGNDTESEESSIGLNQDNITEPDGRTAGRVDKKMHEKSVNSPVYVIIT